MKIKNFFILITLIITSPFSLLYSEENEISNNCNFLGLAASTISGTGLSYGRLFGSDYMVKISGMYYDSREEKSNPADSTDKDFNKTKWWDTGAEFQKNIFSAAKERAAMHFYGLLGGSYWYEKKERPFSPEDNDKLKYYTVGAGFGVRLIIGSRFSFNADIGYQYADRISNKEKYAGLGGGVGINYLF